VSVFSVAGLQLELAAADNVSALVGEVRAAKARHPWLDMVVLPELASLGPRLDQAVRLPGPIERRYCELARALGIWLLPGSLYERRGGRIFNTAPLIDPSGRVVGRYRKIFPWLPYERGVAPGREFVVANVPGKARVGVSICYDSWFPEVSRSLAWLGTEIMLHPTLTFSVDRDVELSIARATAASHQCYVVDINSAGPLGNGRSIVCGPGGEVIHQAGSGRELIAVRLDLDHLRRCRATGWHGLGQPLKSFRDSKLRFPCYRPGRRRSPSLERLGAVRMPKE
jgi:deaminated glutathione amidase